MFENERMIDETMHRINVATQYKRILANCIANGGLSMEAYRLYAAVNNVTPAFNQTPLHLAIVSLEAENNKIVDYIEQLMDFIMKFFDTLVAFFQDHSAKIDSYKEKAVALKKQILSSRDGIFNGQSNQINVEKMFWLCHTSPEFDQQAYLNQFKLQTNTIANTISTACDKYEKITSGATEILNKLFRDPSQNHLKDVYGLAKEFQAMLGKASPTDNGKTQTASSQVYLGGKKFTLQIPQASNSQQLVAGNNKILFTDDNVFNQTVDPQKTIPALSKGGAVDLLTNVILTCSEVNSRATYIANIPKQVNQLARRIKNSYRQLKSTLNDEQANILNVTITMLSSLVKTVGKYFKSLIKTQVATIAGAVQYVTESIKVFNKPSTQSNT